MAGKDIAGKRFGKLVALEQIGRHPRGGFVWRCQCDCGNTKDAITKDLGYGSVKSCGCLHAETEAKKRKVNPGDKFGMLTVVRQAESKNERIKWECLCDCGKTVARATNRLAKSENPNCGCSRKKPIQRSPKASDIKGQRFGRLVALERDRSVTSNRAHWKCLCDCGNEVTCNGTSLRRKITVSCGCYRKELAAKRANENRHLAIAAITTHGMTNSVPHRIWGHMIERCKTKESYVKRGITVCDEWLNDFEAFYEHVGDRPTPKHQLDRIDNDQGYKPGNVRWVTGKVNARNKSNNRIIEYKGESRCASEWAEMKGIRIGLISWRLDNGWSVEKTLETPARHKAPDGGGRKRKRVS